MKHLPIVGKISSILAVFGIFVIFTAFYSTGQMRDINNGYVQLKNGPTDALQMITKANVDVEFMQAHLAQLMMQTTPARMNQESSNVKHYMANFNSFMNSATAARPSAHSHVNATKGC